MPTLQTLRENLECMRLLLNHSVRQLLGFCKPCQSLMNQCKWPHKNSIQRFRLTLVDCNQNWPASYCTCDTPSTAKKTTYFGSRSEKRVSFFFAPQFRKRRACVNIARATSKLQRGRGSWCAVCKVWSCSMVIATILEGKLYWIGDVEN